METTIRRTNTETYDTSSINDVNADIDKTQEKINNTAINNTADKTSFTTKATKEELKNTTLFNNGSESTSQSTQISTKSDQENKTDSLMKNNINTNKLLSQKQEIQTNSHQTPLEKSLAEWEKSLDGKTYDDLQKEKEKIKKQKITSIIISIILAILCAVLLIIAAIFIPFPASLPIIIMAVAGTGVSIANVPAVHEHFNKMIDKINKKISEIISSQQKGNSKTSNIKKNQENNKDTLIKTSIKDNNAKTQISSNTQEKLLNDNLSKDNKKNNQISPDNNITLNTTNPINHDSQAAKKDLIIDNSKNTTNVIKAQITANEQTNNSNDNFLLKKEQQSENINNNDDKIKSTASISTNIKNDVQVQQLNKNAENNTTKINISPFHQALTYVNTNNNNKTEYREKCIAAKDILQKTQEAIMNGTLDLSNCPEKETYQKYKNGIDEGKYIDPQVYAHVKQRMIKYEILQQLKNDEKMFKMYQTNKPSLPKTWQLGLYNGHLKNNENSKQSFIQRSKTSGGTIDDKSQEERVKESFRQFEQNIQSPPERKIKITNISAGGGAPANKTIITNQEKKEQAEIKQ